MTTLPHFRPPSDDFNRYERPAAWVCGRACEGRRCVNGPSPSGRCQDPAEPCIPVRSLRSRRRIFVVACTVFSLAALLIMLSKACWTEAFAPGPLTLNHAQILNKNSTSNRCAACHEAGDKLVGEWALSLVSSHPLPTPQSTLCLKCHDKLTASGGRQTPDTSLLAHGVLPEKLSTHSTENGGHEIACSACHREHHGKDHDLTSMTNQQCQTCHAKTFHSFASGHPEFTSWPFEKPSPIAFNHAVHQGKHFPAGKQEFRCQTCHVDDSRRDVKLLAGFQAACASCHEPKIKQSGEQGFKLFALPGMNVAALTEAGLAIGEWPEGISGDFDGVIPPTMALLLSADEKSKVALAKIPGGDFAAMDPGNKQQVAAAAEIAIACKRLLHELASAGEAGLARRLKLKPAEAARLWANLPPDVLRAARSAWLPKLDEEIALLRAGKPLSLPKTAAVETPAVIKEPSAAPNKPANGDDLLLPETGSETPKSDGDEDLLGGAPEPASQETSPDIPAQPIPTITSAGWQRSDANYSIGWRPAGHGDLLLKAWIDFSLQADAKDSPAAATLRESLTKPTSIGYCVQCHTIDHGPGSAHPNIHWQPAHRDPAQKTFTEFSHRPHLIQPQLADCTHCHEMSPTTAGFALLTKSACTSCHTPTAAGDQCLKCHNYHVSP